MTDDLTRRLLRYHGRDPLLQKLRNWVRFGGELTKREIAEAERHLTAAAVAAGVDRG